MSFSKGDIVWPKMRTQDPKKLRHPAIVWDTKADDKNDFTGIMVTSSKSKNGSTNILMKPEHFLENWKVCYKKSHFVNQMFVKFASWGPFEKVGQLTKDGVAFIEENISQDAPIPFEDYLKNKSRL